MVSKKHVGPCKKNRKLHVSKYILQAQSSRLHVNINMETKNT